MSTHPLAGHSHFTTAASLALALVLLASVPPARAAAPSKAPDAPPAQDDKAPDAKAKKDDAKGWRSLFDGKTLTNWRQAEFGGTGEPEVKDGTIVIPFGERLSGVVWAGERKDLPNNNYEIELKAQRVNGGDFFCGLTVPVRQSHVTLVVGGWGGSLCGISNIGGSDAANNETTHIQSFKTGQWYTVRFRITDDKLQAWIDDEAIIDTVTAGKELDVRSDIDASKPLGISTFATKAAVKDIRVRELTPEEVKTAKEQAAKEKQ
jgi:hypothetical protein